MGGVLEKPSTTGGIVLKVADSRVADTTVQPQQPKRVQSRVLLLGASDSGKSTFCRQMSYQHTDVNTKDYVAPMVCMVLTAIGRLVQYVLKHLPPSEATPELQRAARHIRACKGLSTSYVPNVIAKLVYDTWRLPVIQETYMNRVQWKIPVHSNSATLLEHFVDICQLAYHPSLDFIMKTKVENTGLTSSVVSVSGEDHTFFDLAGFPHRRKLLANNFQKPSCAVFFSALGAFDECALYTSDNEQCTFRLVEDLKLFRQALSYCSCIPICVVFSHMDILGEKLQLYISPAKLRQVLGFMPAVIVDIVSDYIATRTFSLCFPECQDSTITTTDQAVEFMRAKFLAVTQDPNWISFTVANLLDHKDCERIATLVHQLHQSPSPY